MRWMFLSTNKPNKRQDGLVIASSVLWAVSWNRVRLCRLGRPIYMEYHISVHVIVQSKSFGLALKKEKKNREVRLVWRKFLARNRKEEGTCSSSKLLEAAHRTLSCARLVTIKSQSNNCDSTYVWTTYIHSKRN